eukprot:COSAG02_NODE_2775_length_8040_cov_9.109365_5_plen_170_part_00
MQNCHSHPLYTLGALSAHSCPVAPKFINECRAATIAKCFQSEASFSPPATFVFFFFFLRRFAVWSPTSHMTQAQKAITHVVRTAPINIGVFCELSDNTHRCEKAWPRALRGRCWRSRRWRWTDSRYAQYCLEKQVKVMRRHLSVVGSERPLDAFAIFVFDALLRLHDRN